MAGLFVAKVNPKFLHSNSTSHMWPFSAIAELIDNAYDPDVSARQLWIDKEVINGKVCLTFVDDGKGMDLDHLLKMLSLGYCEKDRYETGSASYKPVGQYGNGFKSGSMRLAKDALVLTVQKEAATACVGLLSQTLCSLRNLDTVVLPVMEFTLPDLERSSTADLNMDLSLETILEVSPYGKEEELKVELRKLSRQEHGSGTKIVLFNLTWNKNRMLELDFNSDPEDIRNPETQDDDPESSRQRTKVFEYRQSLRRYCSILFLTPKMKIFIRNKQVENFLIKGALSRRRTIKYRPKGKENDTEITFGRPTGRAFTMFEDYGVMFYHRNRLIRPYVKLGCQNKTDDSHGGEGVIGVVDVGDILQPTHNKQEFLENTLEYRTAITALAKKLNQYCNQNDHHGDTEDEDRNTRWNWVQCDRCMKWRRLPTFASEPMPKKWYCHMNPDLTKNRCDFPQEELSDNEYDIPEVNSPRKRKQPASQRTVGGKRARPDPPLTVKEESDAAERMHPGLTAEAQSTTSHGEGGRMKSATEAQFGTDQSEPVVIPAESTASHSDGLRSPPGVSAGDVSPCTAPRDGDVTGDGHPGDGRASRRHDDTADDVMGQGHCVGVSGMRDVPIAQQVIRAGDVITQVTSKSSASQQVTSKSFSSGKGCNGQGSNDQGSNRQASTSHHAPSVVTDDDTGVSGHDKDDDMGVSGHDKDDDMGVTGHDEDDDTGVTEHDEDDDPGVSGHDKDDDMGVTGHDEDDDTGVTREQAAENNEQLRRFRRNVHTLLSFLVDRQTPDLHDVGPLEEIEDYVQRVLTSLRLPLE